MYEKEDDNCATCCRSVTANDFEVPVPRGMLHRITESLIHILLSQGVPPTTIFNEYDRMPKRIPRTTTAVAPVHGPFVGANDDIAGGAYDHTKVAVEC